MPGTTGESPPEERTIYVANFDEKVTEEILEELFLQAGPLVKVMVRDVKDSNAKYALVEFEDEDSVLYAITLLNGVRLYDREIQVKPRNNTRQEENFRRRRAEIEEIWRGSRNGRRDDRRDRDYIDRRSGSDNRDQRERDRDTRGSRDWDRRDSRGSGNQNSDRSRSSGGDRDRYGGNNRSNNDDSSWTRHSANHHHQRGQQQQPPPLMMADANWRGSAPSLLPPPPPPMLPHQHFVQMMQQQAWNNTQNYGGSRDSGRHHQNPNPPHQNSYQNPNRQYDQRRGGADRNSANHHYQNRNQNPNRGGGRY